MTRKSTSLGITLDIPFNNKKSLADRGFSYAAAIYWNDLPDHIRTAEDIKKLKSQLKTHFFKLEFHKYSSSIINNMSHNITSIPCKVL